MKNICLWCGEWRPSFPANRRFCSASCCGKMGGAKKKLDLKGANRFTAWKIFNNLVAASESSDEFIKLYKHYFGGDKLA